MVASASWTCRSCQRSNPSVLKRCLRCRRTRRQYSSPPAPHRRLRPLCLGRLRLSPPALRR
eukprot:10806944-Alexandrium_andersonii.AAC.1